MNHPKSVYYLAFRLMDGIGPILARKIIESFPTVEDAFEAGPKSWLGVEGVSNKRVKDVDLKGVLNRAQSEIEAAEKNGWKIFTLEDKGFPRRLRQIPDAPLLLFGKGELSLNPSRAVGVVGTRKASQYGKHFIDDFIKDLGNLNVQVISGLALGIDTLAHRASLKNKIPTVAVMGTGLDKIYPSSNRELAIEMGKKGMLLTEFPRFTKPDRENFPQRNRIVAGMCDALVVVESAEKGGALITADMAFAYNRDVLAVPGRVTDPLSQGCLKLIRSQKAGVVCSAEDLKYQLGWNEVEKTSVQKSLFVELNGEEEEIMELFERGGTLAMDEIAVQAGKKVSNCLAILMNLELKGLIRTLPGNQFEPI